MERRTANRRAFLRYLLGSPILAAAVPVSVLESLVASVASGESSPGLEQKLIAAAADAIDVFDFRAVARRNLPPPHYEFLSLGVEREVTLRANREGFAKFGLRPRRLVDVADVDTSTELLGEKLSSPIVLAPAGAQKAFHPEGEVAVARAAKRKDHLQILSTGSSAPLEEVVEARDAPIWFQLYTPNLWPATWLQLRDAEKAGCPAVVLTVDHVGGASRDDLSRYRRPENPECGSCHSATLDKLAGAVLSDLWARMAVLDWDYVDRIRDATSMKLLIKGILTHEDAALCVEHGVDGIVVSNHGGRMVDSGLSTIETLPEIVRAVEGRIPVLIDSGFRRGSDFFKALALGASAVCIGRPYLWGLAAFGQEGVETVLAMLRKEFETMLRQMGTPTLKDITAAHVQRV